MSEANSVRTGQGGTEPPASEPPATPRWVKVTGIVAVLIVLAALVKVLFGGGVGGHGPEMHGGLGGTPAGVSDSAAAAPALLAL